MVTNKRSIKEVSASYLCTACGACNAACPHGAINMKYTNIGRMYADVNSNCVDCGLCQKVCPSHNFNTLKERMPDPFNGSIINTYIAQASDCDIFRNAQSGGLCTSTLAYMFDQGLIDAALVCVTEISSDPKPHAIVIEKKEELAMSQRSNYTPVDVLSALKLVTDKKSVAVVGLPCHIKGATLLSDVIKKYANITYKLGLICDRTLCNAITKVFNSYVGAQMYKMVWRQKYSTKHKSFSYKNAPVVLHGEDDNEKVFSNLYRFALKDMFTAPHCRICYDKMNIYADVVFGDPWGLDDVDWGKGDSLVLARTEIGDKIIADMIDKGYASNVRKPSIQRALDGQFVFEREEQHIPYVNAFRNVFGSSLTDSIFSDIGYIDSDFVQSSMTEFIKFKNNEQSSEKEIIKLARRIIYRKKIDVQISRVKFIACKIAKMIIRK